MTILEQAVDCRDRPGQSLEAENAVRKQRGRPFAKGQSGNPAGKPKGARNRSTLAAEALLDGEADKLTRKAIEMALAGDVVALKLCMERILPPRKDRPIKLPLPPVVKVDDAAGAMDVILAAVADGRITPSEAVAVAGLVDAKCRKIVPKPTEEARQVLKVVFHKSESGAPLLTQG
jgi:Family of unknown function (DUF5681)